MIALFFHNGSLIGHNEKIINSAFHCCPHGWVSVSGLNLEKMLRPSSGTKETVRYQNEVGVCIKRVSVMRGLNVLSSL